MHEKGPSDDEKSYRSHPDDSTGTTTQIKLDEKTQKRFQERMDQQVSVDEIKDGFREIGANVQDDFAAMRTEIQRIGGKLRNLYRLNVQKVAGESSDNTLPEEIAALEGRKEAVREFMVAQKSAWQSAAGALEQALRLWEGVRLVDEDYDGRVIGVQQAFGKLQDMRAEMVRGWEKLCGDAGDQ